MEQSAATVSLSAGEVRFGVAAEGPPVVFLHPLLASGRHWRKVVPQVAAAGFRCFTPTLPLGAHDLPMRPDADLAPVAMADLAAEFLRAIDVGPVTLVGNDSGGALTQIVAARHPDLVARAVLTSCDAFEDFFPPAFRYLSWGARVPGFAVAVGQSLRVRALRHTPLTFGWLAKHKIDHAVIDAYARPFLADAAIRRDVVKFIRGVDRRITMAAAEQLRSFDKPVLLAWSREDKVFSPSLATRLAEQLPNARVAWIDDSYAFSPEDQPEVLARLIVDFCSS